MRLLLDTHALLWSLDRPGRLRREARSAIEDPANEVLVSAVAVWEIALKSSLRKLRPRADLAAELARVPFGELPLTWAHGLQASVLPLHHRDPFDRLLVAQALVEGMPLVSADAVFDRYPIRRLW